MKQSYTMIDYMRGQYGVILTARDCLLPVHPAPGGILPMSSDGDDQMEANIKTQKNP